MGRLPISVLRSLEQSGHFEVKRPRRKRFHRADIIAFTNKLFGLTRDASFVPPRDCITLEKAMRERYGSIERKANLIRALLSTELPIVRNTTGTIDGLLIPQAKFREFFRKQLESVIPRTGTFSFAGCSIGCSREAIPALVELGLLRGERIGRTFYVTEDSIVAFRKEYAPIADIARPSATSPAKLIRHCQENGIKLLVVPSTRRNRATSFMHVADQQLVLSTFPKKGPSICSASETLPS